MERINIDTIGPLPESHSGYKHIITLIDCFTRWVTLYPVKDLTARTATTQLCWHFGHWGTPTQVLHDAGTQFENTDIIGLLALTGATNVVSIPYSKQENTQVERANKEIMRHLRNVIVEELQALDWEQHLGTIMRIINTQRRLSDVTNAEFPSPAELIFGNSITLDRQLFVTPEEFKAHGTATLRIERWADTMLKTQAALLQQTAQHQWERDEKFRKLESNGVQVRFRENQYVLLDYPSTEARVTHRGPPNKFLPFLKGPFKITHTLSGSYYTIQCLITDKEDNVHVSRLRPFLTYRTGNTDEQVRQVAMMDYLYDYPIESILEHNGIPSSRRKLQFLVRWKNYGKDRDSWIDYSLLRENEVLHKYILALNDKSFLPLIPEKFHKDYGIQRAVRAARVPPEHLPTTVDHLQDNATLTAITKQAQTAQARAKRKK
jgi:hypothetical protein